MAPTKEACAQPNCLGVLDAGEKLEDIAADYDLALAEVEQAALYERAA